MGRLSDATRRRPRVRLRAWLLAGLSALVAFAVLLWASETWLRLRPVPAEERVARDEGTAYGKLLEPARTPHLAKLAWINLRPNITARVGPMRRGTNALGFRDVPHPASKPPGVFRLVVIGDSYVYGQGIADVADIFPRRLGLDRIGDRPLEVIMMGYCGADLLVYNAMFQDLALPLQPDAVLVSLVSNDLEDRTVPSEPCLPEIARSLFRSTPLVLAEAEKRCNNLTRHYERQLARQFDPETAGFRRERAALAEMRDIAERRGIDLLAFFFHNRPDPLGMDRVYRGLTGSLGIPYASLAPTVGRLLQGGAAQEDFDVSRFDGHPNERTHGLAAEVVTAFLRDRYAGTGSAGGSGGGGQASEAGARP